MKISSKLSLLWSLTGKEGTAWRVVRTGAFVAALAAVVVVLAVGVFGAAHAVISLLAGYDAESPPAAPPVRKETTATFLARIAPEECVFFTSWTGLPTPDADGTNEVEKLLAEPEVQQLLAQVERQIVTAFQRSAAGEGDEAVLVAQHAPALVKTLFKRPAAWFVSRLEPGPGRPDVSAALVVSMDAEQQAVKASLEKLQSSLPGLAVQDDEVGGRHVYCVQPDREGPPVFWTMVGNYLIVGVGEEAIPGVVARAETAPPQWLTDIEQALPVERPWTVSYVNVEKLVDVFAPKDRLPFALLGPSRERLLVRATGLEGVKSLASVTGLEGRGFVGRSLVQLDGEAAGLVRLVSDRPLTAEDLAPIPADSTLALALRLDSARALDVLLETVGQIDRRGRQEMAKGIDQANADLGLDVRADVLETLGDVWCVYSSPGEGGLIPAGLTACVTVTDRDRFAASYDLLIGKMKAQWCESDEDGLRRSGARLQTLDVGGREVFVLTGIDDKTPFAPSWCLTDSHLVLALFPQNIKAFLSRGDDYRSLATASQVKALLAEGQGPSFVLYQDTPELFRLGYPLLQMLAAVASSELQREGVELDVSSLPSPQAILPHLGPGVTYVRRTKTGIEFETRQNCEGSRNRRKSGA